MFHFFFQTDCNYNCNYNYDYDYNFISKVSNLLLYFETEGAGGFEFHPTNEISSKYICDVFLMIYLSIFLLLLLVL